MTYAVHLFYNDSKETLEIEIKDFDFARDMALAEMDGSCSGVIEDEQTGERWNVTDSGVVALDNKSKWNIESSPTIRMSNQTNYYLPVSTNNFLSSITIV
jgi:hypothetical protein